MSNLSRKALGCIALLPAAAFDAIYSFSKDLGVAFGIVRDIMDGEARTTQATAGLTWRVR